MAALLLLLVGIAGVWSAARLRRPPADEPRPKHYVSILSPDRNTQRRQVVGDLYSALDRGDVGHAAALNASLAREAFQRAFRAMDAWETVRDRRTGLTPRATDPRMAYWLPRDNGADSYAFFLMASLYRDGDAGGRWRATLDSERRLCGPMPCAISLKDLRPIARGVDEEIFDASEYAKDGLLALSERFGQGPWWHRMEEIIREIIRRASVPARIGRIPSNDSETNGNLLQVLTRLHWATREPQYLEMAERIGETYLFEIYSQTDGIPVRHWDFARGQPASPLVRFTDHGNEIIAGLAELYLLERKLGRPQAERYRAPLRKVLARVLRTGRTPDGLWHNDVDFHTGHILHSGVIDTWGYVLNAHLIFDLAEGTRRYEKEIRRVMNAAAARKSFPWEGEDQDGYADSLESMMYLLPWFGTREHSQWLDDQIEIMFSKQFPSGFVEEWYLDGNFIRTSLLYAMYKTQGLLARPWRADLRLGAARPRNRRELHVYIGADAAWRGVLQFDPPRHRTIWTMPVDYPRLNSTPEWFPIDPQKTYSVVDVDSGTKASYSGRTLVEGLPLTLSLADSSRRLRITEGR